MAALIERLHRHVQFIGECWEWEGAVQSSAPTPMMRWGEKTMPVRRVIAMQQGLDVHQRVVTCSCRNDLCVSPDHVVVMTRRKLQKIIAKERNYQSNPLRMKRVSDKARVHAKLTLELAAEIREADGPQREIAARYGITQATVSSIKRGKTWRDYTNPFAQILGALNK